MDSNTYNMEITLQKLVDEILPGYRNFVFHDPKVEAVAKERLKLCVECEHLNHFVRSKKWGKKCSVCGCPVLVKIRSMDSKCPKGKW